jgi:hypothetical protein
VAYADLVCVHIHASVGRIPQGPEVREHSTDAQLQRAHRRLIYKYILHIIMLLRY